MTTLHWEWASGWHLNVYMKLKLARNWQPYPDIWTCTYPWKCWHKKIGGTLASCFGGGVNSNPEPWKYWPRHGLVHPCTISINCSSFSSFSAIFTRLVWSRVHGACRIMSSWLRLASAFWTFTDWLLHGTIVFVAHRLGICLCTDLCADEWDRVQHKLMGTENYFGCWYRCRYRGWCRCAWKET